ncbi:hypothetical protein BK133_03730 [Paenibacillus sp. FSL H8-0548]|uniref:hypothetical protein n=1 Tax=Paenibacillus sp. FSL H8-0548 TaxID=1920422 RepID=UPI00096D0918|nr:hypothetical protein [Paenibacillus sp. FSL H8-0548]OMF38095.1 hypothetical protein BK133_03730 [Paenibacillus sp. FSL H8-0548]
MKRRKRAQTNTILPTEIEPVEEPIMSQDTPAMPAVENSDSMLTRIGGFDGIMSMMGTAQKFMGFFQQMRPAFKLVNSLFGAKAFLSSVPNHRRNRTKIRKSSSKLSTVRNKKKRK